MSTRTPSGNRFIYRVELQPEDVLEGYTPYLHYDKLGQAIASARLHSSVVEKRESTGDWGFTMHKFNKKLKETWDIHGKGLFEVHGEPLGWHEVPQARAFKYLVEVHASYPTAGMLDHANKCCIGYNDLDMAKQQAEHCGHYIILVRGSDGIYVPEYHTKFAGISQCTEEEWRMHIADQDKHAMDALRYATMTREEIYERIGVSAPEKEQDMSKAELQQLKEEAKADEYKLRSKTAKAELRRLEREEEGFEAIDGMCDLDDKTPIGITIRKKSTVLEDGFKEGESVAYAEGGRVQRRVSRKEKAVNVLTIVLGAVIQAVIAVGSVSLKAYDKSKTLVVWYVAPAFSFILSTLALWIFQPRVREVVVEPFSEATGWGMYPSDVGFDVLVGVTISLASCWAIVAIAVHVDKAIKRNNE